MQEVTGSTPVFSTKPSTKLGGFFFMYWTYILYSPLLDKYYVGSCADLEKRLHDHAVGHSVYTKQGKPWMLKWSSTFESRSEAVKEEMRIKSKKSRKYIEWLIAQPR